MSQLTAKEQNIRLLHDLYDAVCNTLRSSKGQVGAIATDYYIDGPAIVRIVEQAIRDEEHKAWDAYRKSLRTKTNHNE